MQINVWVDNLAHLNAEGLLNPGQNQFEFIHFIDNFSFQSYRNFRIFLLEMIQITHFNAESFSFRYEMGES